MISTYQTRKFLREQLNKNSIFNEEQRKLRFRSEAIKEVRDVLTCFVSRVIEKAAYYAQQRVLNDAKIEKSMASEGAKQSTTVHQYTMTTAILTNNEIEASEEQQISIHPHDIMNAIREMNLQDILNAYTFLQPRENDGEISPFFLQEQDENDVCSVPSVLFQFGANLEE
jgi:hypothetical protein